MSHCRKKQWLALLFAAVLVLIMAGSLMPVAEIPESEKTFRERVMSVVFNLMHVPMYGVLTLVSLHYFECIRFSRPVCAAVTALIAMSVGVLIEVLQIYVPGRYGSFSDIGLNATGIAGGMVLFFKICCKAEE
ncbi:MAG: VanZ family protein [Desulfotignum sp.]|nr:VanZ family protein [Desulfotignum sp.]MCF8125455.1 VanZ family protein [Desulfotignum sp.]